MSEEKILGGDEELKENQVNLENEVIKKDSLEQKEVVFEQSENNAQEKIKQAEDQIAVSSATVQEDDAKVEIHTQDVANLDTIEEQIQKLTEIATQDSPKMALKVARALNSNYALDKMHDRLINEEDLREILIKKGFIENV